MYDTIAIAERLEAAGMQQRMAKAVAQEFANNAEQLATKEDIVGVKEDIVGVKEDIRSSEGRLLVFLGLFMVLQTGLMTLLLWLFTRVLG